MIMLLITFMHETKKAGSFRSLRANKDTLQADKQKNAAFHARIFTVNYRQGNGVRKRFGVFIGSQIIHLPHAQSLLFGHSGVLTSKAILRVFGRMKLHSTSMDSVMWLLPSSICLCLEAFRKGTDNPKQSLFAFRR